MMSARIETYSFSQRLIQIMGKPPRVRPAGVEVARTSLGEFRKRKSA